MSKRLVPLFLKYRGICYLPTTFYVTPKGELRVCVLTYRGVPYLLDRS